jgi:hypothetical protein
MAKRHSVLLAFVATTAMAAASAPRQATSPAQATGTGLILGQVIDADTGRGVSGMVVTIGAPAPFAPATAELVDIRTGLPAPVGRTQRVFTAPDGRFVFRDLPKGSYVFTTAGAGYVPGAYGEGRPEGPGQALDLGDGQKLGGVTIRAWKYASISGLVTDDFGEPAVGVAVRAFRRRIAGGHPRFDAPTFVTSDDRGVYRVSGVVPDDYVVGVTPIVDSSPLSLSDLETSGPNRAAGAQSLSDSGATNVTEPSGFRVGDSVIHAIVPTGAGSSSFAFRPAPTPDGRMRSYRATFFPGAASLSQATLIHVKSGEARQGIDLSLTLVPAVRVSGTITGPGGAGALLGVRLAPTTAGEFQSDIESTLAQTASDATGRFTFLGIPAGEYMLRVRLYPHAPLGTPFTPGAETQPPPDAPSLWASQGVTVGDKNVDDVAIVLRAGLAVGGRIAFSGTRPAPSPDQLQRVAITLQSAEGRTSNPIVVPASAAADGSFQTARYAGGRYLVSVSSLPAGWSVASIMSNGKDISVEPFELADTDLTGVLVTCTDRPGAIAGTVAGASGSADGADVIVFPADSTAWRDIGVPARRGRDQRVELNGMFSITNLPPGDYFVVALSGVEASEWRDPKLLDSLIPLATRVALANGGTASVSLKVVQPVRHGPAPRGPRR